MGSSKTLKNAFKKHPLQNRTNVQIKGGGGVKGLLNNVKKNCTFLGGWHPLLKWLKWVCFWQNCTKTMIRVGSDKKLSGWIMDLLLALKILCPSQQGRTVPPWGRDGNSNFLSWINNKRRNRNTGRDFLRGYWTVDTFMKKSPNSKYFWI